MNWETIKSKKWRGTIIICLSIFIIFLLIIFSIKSLLFRPPEPHIMEPLKPTNLWYNNYNVGENLNTFELPYSEMILNCPVYIDIRLSDAPRPIEEGKEHRVFVESIKLEGKELLLEPTTIRHKYGKFTVATPHPLLLDHILTKTEGVLVAKMVAERKYNVSIKMSQYKGVC